MVRSKVTYKYVAEPYARKQTLRKRKAGLLKKASQLRTLCDTDICAIIYNEETNDLDLWPSLPEVHHVIERFNSSSTMFTSRTKLDQEGLLGRSIEKLSKDIAKDEKKNKQCEMELAMLNYLFDGNVGDLGDPEDLCAALDEAIAMIDEKNQSAMQADSMPVAPEVKPKNGSAKGKEKMYV